MSQVALTIPLESFKVERALLSWQWLCPKDHTPLSLTAFGDWVLKAPNGNIMFLDTLEGRITKIAESVSEFEKLKETPENRDKWFMEGFLLGLSKRGVALKTGECFGFEKPPILGGKIEVNNIKPFFISVYQTVTGQLHEQLSKRPEGSKITGFVLKE